ncbi:hypothetical protein ACTFIY_009813 [Dictyostelium cf. discoideum]
MVYRNLFFYTDSNIDDIIALQSILSNDSEFKLRGICVSDTGFTTTAIGSDTIFKVFNFMAEKDYDRYKELFSIPVPIEILSTGPATELAILLTLYPNVVDNIELVSQMGGPKLLLTPLDATDTNPITKDFFYNEINKPSTYSGQWLQALFTSVKNILTDPLFFNINHIYGKGFYNWDFESYRVIDGQITISSASSKFNKTRICTYINSNSSHSLSNIYKYKLP